MNKLSLIFLLLLMNLVAGAQFLDEDKQWNVRLTGFPGLISTEIFRIDGDSTVNSLSYKKIWVTHDSLSSWLYQGLLREDSNMVYYIPMGCSEGVLYDFTLETGDTAYVKNIFCGDEEVPVYVLDVDTVDYFGEQRKRWHLGEYDYVEEYWVEGIGSLNGPLYTKFWYCIVCPVWELLCYYDSENLLYIYPGEEVCYQQSVGIADHSVSNGISVNPNPVSKGEILEIISETDPVEIEIYNLSGVLIREIRSFQSNHISIETNGFGPGMYLMNVRTKEHGSFTQKFLVK